jgi:LexA-binding, inner membrane-associated putative hydrolase
MDLPTHAFFGFAFGIVVFGRPEIAFLVALGTLLPDLDREYWFIPSKFYREEQYHRALLHNVFFMLIACIIHPFLAIGVFLHMMLDSFTTSKDRGCEWFFPFSRLVKRGRYNVDMEPQRLDPEERVYFYHEDLQATIEYADPYLPEPPPSPWRRVYGPALNSSLLDKGFLYGSLALIIMWMLFPNGSNLALFSTDLSMYVPFATSFLSVFVLFLAGELDRRDQDAPLERQRLSFLKRFSMLKYLFFSLGIALFAAWVVLFWREISINLQAIASKWLFVTLAATILAVIGFAILKIQTRNGKPEAIV